MPVVAAAAARVAGTVLARVIPPLSTNVTVSSSASPSATAADGTAACRTGQDGVGSLDALPHVRPRCGRRGHARDTRRSRTAPQPRRRREGRHDDHREELPARRDGGRDAPADIVLDDQRHARGADRRRCHHQHRHPRRPHRRPARDDPERVPRDRAPARRGRVLAGRQRHPRPAARLDLGPARRRPDPQAAAAPRRGGHAAVDVVRRHRPAVRGRERERLRPVPLRHLAARSRDGPHPPPHHRPPLAVAGTAERRQGGRLHARARRLRRRRAGRGHRAADGRDRQAPRRSPAAPARARTRSPRSSPTAP